MRRPFIAGNWKMNLNRAEAMALARGLAEAVGGSPKADVAICPPSCYLDPVAQIVKGSAVALGAQNVYHEANGAFTGELSTTMLLDLGCKYVILGHSERRHILQESNADVNKKVHAALQAGLTPIVCVGELLAEREANQTAAVVRDQVEGSLAGVSAEKLAGVVFAYEPVWAIGTGKVASPEQAEEVHKSLRKLLAERYNAAVAERVIIQYGGSVNPKNSADLLKQENIDGFLVGGASLKVDTFLGVIGAAQ